MRTPILLPDLGRLPAVLSHWYAAPGDAVTEGERLVEVLAGYAAVTIASPATGRLADRRALPNDPLEPGCVLGTVVGE